MDLARRVRRVRAAGLGLVCSRSLPANPPSAEAEPERESGRDREPEFSAAYACSAAHLDAEAEADAYSDDARGRREGLI